MNTVINYDFMLHGQTSKILYHKYAENLPIIDYHCHLSPAQIAENYRFENVGELFLGGDHYKWRQMRTFGIEEKYITGDASYHDKFLKFAEMMPYLLGNPIYHWTHLELKRYFGIEEALCPENAEEIWNKCNTILAQDKFSAKGLIESSNVKVICTTDDPADDLRYHKKIKADGFRTKVLPTFRPDKLINIDKTSFADYVIQNGIRTFDDVKKFIAERAEFFNDNGCKLSDHSLEYIPCAFGDAEKVFNKSINGEKISADEAAVYKTEILSLCAAQYAKYGWTMQLHIGALRNNNGPMFRAIGPDAGYDSINDLNIAEPLSGFLNSLEEKDILPKTILYTLNPKDNYVLGTMIGNFQKAPVKGRIQFGSAWWFNDHADGMRKQMTDLANLGMLSGFVGMLTDSRSFVSYPRHEYFRRILCDLIGKWVDDGEYPNDEKMLGEIIANICYYNAEKYFGF